MSTAPGAWLPIVGFVLGVAVTEVFRLVRDLTVERRHDTLARTAEERRWEREDTIRAETATQALAAERRKSERDQALWDRQVQGARRLVADELDTIFNHLQMMIRRGHWPDPRMVELGNFLSLVQWEQHKATLASAIEDQIQFFNLAGFAYSVRQLAARIATVQAGTEFDPTERDRLQRMRDDAHALYWVVLGSHVLDVSDDGALRIFPVDEAPPMMTPSPYGPARPDGSMLRGDSV